MAKIILKDCFIELDAIDLTNNVRSVEVNLSKANVDASTMGGQDIMHGREQSSFTINWAQSFEPGEVDETLYGHWSAETAFKVTVRPKKAQVVSASNPEYSGMVKLLEYIAIGGAAGDLAETSTTLPVVGGIARDVTV